MKANEVPEKIYLKPLLMENGESIMRRCTLERQNDNQIEYVRKDAFIKKTNKWFEKHLWEHVYGGIEMKNNIFEDFKKYMEE